MSAAADEHGRVPEVEEAAPPVVAVLGSRRWPDGNRVASWVWRLADKYPRAVVLSGGIGNVHVVATREALRRGLCVGVLTPTRRPSGAFEIREEQLLPDRDVKERGDEPFVTKRERLLPGLEFPDFASCAKERSTLLVEQATQVQVFHYAGSPGTWHERNEARRLGRPLHVIELEEAEWRARKR